MYLATNLGHSPKAVRKARGRKKHCSHLDIHKTPVPAAIAGFIKIPQQREEEGMQEEEGQRGDGCEEENEGKTGCNSSLGYLC